MPKPDLAPFAARVVAAVKAYVAKAEAATNERLNALSARLDALPAPEKGEPGSPGEPGKDGKDGRDGIDGKDGVPGKDGEKGEKGDPGEDGAAGIEGKEGRAGKDGTHGRDGQPGAPGPAGRDGENGKDGRDGLSPEDFTLSLEGRTLTIGLKRGEVMIERQVKLAFPLDCGVYRQTEKYEKGDGVTFGGHFWIAQIDEPADKPGLSDQWRLAVKRGRDGKDAR